MRFLLALAGLLVLDLAADAGWRRHRPPIAVPVVVPRPAVDVRVPFVQVQVPVRPALPCPGGK